MRVETTTDTESSAIMTGDQKPSVAAHTPGPWNVGCDDDGGFVFDGDMQRVADTFHQPDAVLIAAAPELLEALRECADDLEAEVMERYSHGANVYQDMARKRKRDMAPVCKARAAIAKATGTEPGSPVATDQSNAEEVVP